MKKVTLVLVTILISWAASAQSSKKSNTTEYGSNIFRLYPLSVFAYGGVGLGAGYERILDKEGKVGINIPLYFGMLNNYNSNVSNGLDYSFMINPGVKFYPLGQRRITYGLGMSVFYLQGSQVYANYYQNSPYYFNANHWRSGLLLDNSVQFNISPKLNVGLTFGLGPSYLNRVEQYDYNSNSLKVGNEGIQFMANAGFHVGFRI